MSKCSTTHIVGHTPSDICKGSISSPTIRIHTSRYIKGRYKYSEELTFFSFVLHSLPLFAFCLLFFSLATQVTPHCSPASSISLQPLLHPPPFVGLSIKEALFSIYHKPVKVNPYELTSIMYITKLNVCLSKLFARFFHNNLFVSYFFFSPLFISFLLFTNLHSRYTRGRNFYVCSL